jgi:hypothetical protein
MARTGRVEPNEPPCERRRRHVTRVLFARRHADFDPYIAPPGDRPHAIRIALERVLVPNRPRCAEHPLRVHEVIRFERIGRRHPQIPQIARRLRRERIRRVPSKRDEHRQRRDRGQREEEHRERSLFLRRIGELDELRIDLLRREKARRRRKARIE